MSHSFYNVVHILGIALVLTALGGVCVHAANGGEKAENRIYRLILTLHGIGALLILFAGFGMLAKLNGGSSAFPTWVWPKLLIWVLLGGAIVLPYRVPASARPLLVIVPLLALLAAYFAIFKPL